MKNNTDTIRIITGIGTAPIIAKCKKGETISSVLARENITIEPGYSLTRGGTRIIDPDKDTVEPGDLIIIAPRLSNG